MFYPIGIFSKIEFLFHKDSQGTGVWKYGAVWTICLTLVIHKGA